MFMTQITTLGFLVRFSADGEINEICLGMKKIGFGKGNWNGFGGKVGDKTEFCNESIEESLVREAREEFSVDLLDFEKVGVIDFENVDNMDNIKNIQTHIFLVKSWTGDVTESQEMAPKWFKVCDIPFDEMWADDKYWFPRMLKKEYFNAYFNFKDNQIVSFGFRS